MKKWIVCVLALAMLGAALTACAKQEAPAQNSGDREQDAPAAQTQDGEEDEENYATGDASLDNPRNQDGIGDKELLVVSFGTSFNDNRRLTVGGIEGALEKAFPDWSVRRGFTSQIIIDHVRSRDGEVIDNVGEALDRAVKNGVKTLAVQPTHLMNGFEYTDLEKELASYADSFDRVVLGEPLLTSEDDFSRVADIIVEATREYDDGETAICFMGHGTEADSNAVYARMQQVLASRGRANYYIGTVEAEPSVQDVLAAVKAGSYKRVVLEPLMIVAGDHANNDMAGDEEDSWKSIFEGAGYEVVCLLRGLGELEPIQALFAEHAREAIDSLADTSKVADASQTAAAQDVGAEGMTPVPASELADGTYEAAVDCSSSMFKIERCELTVANGAITAGLTLGSDAYGYLFAGTAAEAAAADKSAYIEPEGRTFRLPVSALDAPVPCAAWSRNKELWYDRTLVFRSDSLPLTAFKTLKTAAGLGLADGTYTVEVTLGGGSGRASVQTPARLWIENGAATAEIVWSSANYDYMKVDGAQIDAEITDGYSTFVIPVAAFDRPLGVLADTTAMSQPHEIEYTLTFASATIAAS